MGVRPEPVHTDPRPGDVRHTQADLSAAERDLGHRPAVGFEEGLRRTVAWFASRA
jgi:nucleoside-diphosphate-sugar epimerase